MFAAWKKNSLTTVALAVCIAVATGAEAAPYGGNLCVAKKQIALSKYTKMVAKAWVKYPADSSLRNMDIATAFTKLDLLWTKAEELAVKKNATCNESTAASADAAAIVDNAVAAVATENFPAVTDYVSKAIKSWGKYIKDPTKDAGRTKLNTDRSAASTKYLSSENMAVNTAATTLESSLVDATTNAPDYPTTFQKIEPGSSVMYGKKELKPVCVDGDPYVYFARKGTTNKVLMYYQGGGACWDSTTCYFNGGSCDRISNDSDNPALFQNGFGDWTDPQNPFSEYNVVFVSYCTCDIHWGENYALYGNSIGRHYGRVNAQVAEKFAREHFVDPEQVFVTGSSAGSYGAIMNSYWLMRDVWPNAEFAVLGDAGVGVITQGFLDNYMTQWGVENNFPTDVPGVSLPVQSLSMVDLIDGLATKYPNNRFANYDTSYDGGSGSQCQFLQAMRYQNDVVSRADWWESACVWNACMRDFKAENYLRTPANYRYFTGAGTRHTMFGSDKVYTEAKSTRSDTNLGMTIRDWVAAMADDTSDWVNVDCNNPGGDCSLTNSCQGGTNAGGFCTGNIDCPGGSCQNDPDNANPPFNNDDTVTCSPTVCPCGLAAAKCVGGSNDGNTCTTGADCPVPGTCVYINCSAQ